jgi:5-methylcytosine-specific restriction endonuclease McrA
MKIGKLVRHYADSIFEYCETKDPTEFARLQEPAYSKEQFGLYYSFCCEAHQIAPKDHKRYRMEEYSVNGKTVRICSQWFSRSLPLLETYLRNRGLLSPKMPIVVPTEAAPDPEVAPRKARGRYRSHAIGNAQNATVRNLLGQIGSESFNAEDWQQVKQDFDNRCAYCGGEDKLVMDHIVPINQTHLGEHRLGNLAPACEKCNRAKSSKDFREFLTDAPDRIQLIEAHMRRHDYEPMSERDDIKKVVELAYQEVRQVADRYATIIETMLED